MPITLTTFSIAILYRNVHAVVITCIETIPHRFKKAMYLKKDEGFQKSTGCRRRLALSCPPLRRQLVIAFSLITIIFLSLRFNSNLSCTFIHEMSWLKSWLSVIFAAVIATGSAKSTVVDLSAFQWTLSNPSLNISVPAKIPSQVI
jgi:hypothetical protein